MLRHKNRAKKYSLLWNYFNVKPHILSFILFVVPALTPDASFHIAVHRKMIAARLSLLYVFYLLRLSLSERLLPQMRVFIAVRWLRLGVIWMLWTSTLDRTYSILQLWRMRQADGLEHVECRVSIKEQGITFLKFKAKQCILLKLQLTLTDYLTFMKFN